MTIEEKAKAYDEAIERAKKWRNAPNADKIPTFANRVIDEIFPELKESEDEKIRKWLINYFREVCDNVAEKKKNAVLAWLEKQTTPQVRTGLEWVNTIDDACDKRYSEEYAHGEYCHEQSFKWGFQEGVDWLEKQGEPTDINPSEFDSRLNKLLKQFETLPKEELINCLSFYLNVVQNDGTYREEKQGEQKPKLTEVEEAVKNLMNTYRDAIKAFQSTWFLEELKKIEQKPIEWSEEDEKKLNRIYMLLAEAADEHAFSTTCRLIGDNECVELQDFLKSLKPQNHWKPSDEQLEALKNAIHIKPFENPSDSLLWGLYEQIKKLKE